MYRVNYSVGADTPNQVRTVLALGAHTASKARTLRPPRTAPFSSTSGLTQTVTSRAWRAAADACACGEGGEGGEGEVRKR